MLVDTNLLLYAKMADLPQHEVAARWLDGLLSGNEPVGLPWESLVGFGRIATSGRVFRIPLASITAWEQVDDWLGCPPVFVPTPGPRHRAILAELVQRTRPVAGTFHDAHLAALAIEHGLLLCSADGDFARFPGLRWSNPVA